ncbi:MAG: hypothetical protein IPL46_16225 [Saprospiraceae bacterium]|nr:hypothetical protein [Saprospiraceae bacterium]
MILKLLRSICTELESRKIPYMLSGIMAMNIYTIPRMTRDIDIVINLRNTDIPQFVEIFKEGYYIFE